MSATVVSLASTAAAALVLAHGAWWTLLNVVALPRPRGDRPLPAAGRPSMVIVVPAHNEAEGIAACVASLRSSVEAYGPARVLVVADNCDDGTAVAARDAGAAVIERTDPERRGKAYALDFALAHLGNTGPPEVVAFVDADSSVTENFCEAVAAALRNQSAAVQVHYATGAGDQPLQRLRRNAFLLAHWSRQLGATRLGLGTGIKGNGMALRWELASAGTGGHGVTEDAAMTLSLAERGIPVRFVPSATVQGDMPGHYGAAQIQDARWEGGRFALVPQALRIAAGQLLRGRIATAAAAAEVGSLPLSILVGVGGLALLLALAGAGNVTVAAAAMASLMLYVGTGLAAARAGWRDLEAFAHVPRFLAHKAAVYARVVLRGQPKTWQRTERKRPQNPGE